MQINFATEQMMDSLAEAAGIDPLEFRYINALRPGQLLANGCGMDSYPIPGMLERLRPKYRAALERAKRDSTDTHKKGVGVCCSLFKASAGANDRSEVRLELNPDGTVTHFNSWEDMGQGADVGTLIHTYEALRPLGLRPERSGSCRTTRRRANSGPSREPLHFVAARPRWTPRKNCSTPCASRTAPTARDEMVAEGIPYSTGLYSRPACHIDRTNGLQQDCVMYARDDGRTTVEIAAGKVKVDRFISDVGGRLAPGRGGRPGGIMHGIGTALSEDYQDIKSMPLLGAGFPFIDSIPDDIEIEFMDSYREGGPWVIRVRRSFQSSPTPRS